MAHTRHDCLGLLALAALTVASCWSESDQHPSDSNMTNNASSPLDLAAGDPPVAEKRPIEIEQHGTQRVDNYAWLRDDGWQEVLSDPDVLRSDIRDHLNAENGYYEDATNDLQPLRDQLFQEMRGRIKEDDSSVPIPDGPYAYAVRYRDGGEYPIFVRTLRDGSGEKILFDGDDEGEGEDFFRVLSVNHSPNHELITYGVDRVGSEYYDIRVRKIETGDEYEETIPSTNGSAVWAADSRSFYYVERDANQRPKRVKHHVLGTDPADDLLVYEEDDDTLFLTVDKSQSGAYIFIVSQKGTTSVSRYLPADAEPNTEPTLVAPQVDD